MEFKDTRSKTKRKHDHHNSKYRKPNNPVLQGGSSSSTTPAERLRGVVDVADSSDEFLIGRQRNWNRLNSLEDESDTVAVAGNDFTMLANQSVTAGGHFVLSSEKHWLEAADEFEEIGSQWLDITSKFFSFNAKHVQAALRAVPFHRLMDYECALFSRDELAAMNKEAEAGEVEYQKMVPSTGKLVVAQPDELDEILASTANDTLKITVQQPTVSKDDEEWLDSVLAE